MKNACAVSRPLWFQGPAHSQPPGQDMLIKTHDAIGAVKAPFSSFPEFSWLSISCQQNHNETFLSVIPENQRRRRLPLAKSDLWLRCLHSPSLPVLLLQRRYLTGRCQDKLESKEQNSDNLYKWRSNVLTLSPTHVCRGRKVVYQQISLI